MIEVDGAGSSSEGSEQCPAGVRGFKSHLPHHASKLSIMFRDLFQTMTGNRQAESEETLKGLRNLLPYLKNWSAWQGEIRRLERNIVKFEGTGMQS